MVNDDPEKPNPNDEVKKLETKIEKITKTDKDYIRQLQKDIADYKRTF